MDSDWAPTPGDLWGASLRDHKTTILSGSESMATTLEVLPDHWATGCSNAKQWVNCPGSKWAVDDSPAGVMALLGTLGHRIVECLLNGESIELDEDEQGLMDDLDADGKTWFTSAIMVCYDHVRGVMDDMEEGDVILFETKIKSEKIPDHGGTCDVILYRAREKSLHVIDFKFGRVAVDGHENYQIAAYLTLARQLFPDAETFTGTIVQPAYKGVDCHDYPKAWLNEWLIKAAVAADPNNKTLKADASYCEWCPLLATCEEFAREARRMAHKFEAIKEVEKPTAEDMKTLELIVISAKVATKQKDEAGKLLKEWARTGGKLTYHRMGSLTRMSWADDAAAKDVAAAGDVPEIDLVEFGIVSPAKLRDILGIPQEKFEERFKSVLQLKKSPVMRAGPKPKADEAKLFDPIEL